MESARREEFMEKSQDNVFIEVPHNHNRENDGIFAE